MPLTCGDVNTMRFVNELEARIEALEKAVAKVPKAAVTPAAAEKIAEAKVEEAKVADRPTDAKSDR